MHEVFAYGVIAASTLIQLADPYPPEAGYAEIAGTYPSIGGEAAGSALVLARLGVPTKLAGTRLGRDAESVRVVDTLTAAGVDCSDVARDGDEPVYEVVVSTQRERTVLGTYGRMLAEAAWSPPSRSDIRASRIVCLDPFFGEASAQAARWCRESGIRYVTVDVVPDSPIARHAAAVIVSGEFAGRTFGPGDVRDLLARYCSACSGLVVLTGGADALLYGRSGAPPREATPFTVDVRDTTGAGDSFRAGLIHGMLREEEDDVVIRTASAVSALVCERVPGVVGSPRPQELEAFLGSRG